jgi:hypothetical protein
VALSPGDRFELPLTREAWASESIPLAGGFRYLLASTGAPTMVTLRGESGRSAAAVWDGGRGRLDVQGLRDLVRAMDGSERLVLEVEDPGTPAFRIGLSSGALRDGEADRSARVIGAIPVRFDPADAEILGAFARGIDAPLATYELNRWAHTIALTPGFDELVSLPFLRDVIPYDHQLAAVKTVLNRMRGRALLGDEVGLGKTVEAGIVLSELLRRRLARRVLVLVPPGLVTQCRRSCAGSSASTS